MLDLDKSTWNRVKLGDVVKPSKEKVDPSSGVVERYVAGEHMDSDDLKIHRWGEVGDKDLGPAFHRRFRPGQVLYGSRRTYLRKVSVADFDGVCANTTFVLETAEKSELLQEFLPFVMTSERFHAFAIGESKGSVNPYVNWSDIAKFEFDLPPLEEQKRIADLLWAVEQDLTSNTALGQALSLAAASALSRLWEEGTEFQDLGSLGQVVTGTTPSKRLATYWDSEDVPFLTPSELQGDTMLAARQFVSNEGAKKGRVLPANSVAVACIGGALGKTAVLSESCMTNQQITAITGLDEDDAYLLRELLAHRSGQQAIFERETTTVVRKLNKSDLMKISVPWPPDRSFARTAVRKSRSARARLEANECALVRLRTSLSTCIFGDS